MSRKIAVNMPSDVAYEITLLARATGLSFSAQAAELLAERLRQMGRLRPNPDRLAVTSSYSGRHAGESATGSPGRR